MHPEDRFALRMQAVGIKVEAMIIIDIVDRSICLVSQGLETAIHFFQEQAGLNFFCKGRILQAAQFDEVRNFRPHGLITFGVILINFGQLIPYLGNDVLGKSPDRLVILQIRA